MKVFGTASIGFEIELEVEDISEDSMTFYESDDLIANEIQKKLPTGMIIEGDIFVKATNNN